MPSMDMSAAFGAEMLDIFDVIRRKQNANDFGEAVVVADRYVGVRGVVDAGDENKIAIVSDEQHQGKSLSVVTQFKLRGVSKENGQEYAPDLIFWNGDFFKVILVEDYSRYGFGWIQAQCTSEDFVDKPPPVGIKQTVINPPHG